MKIQTAEFILSANSRAQLLDDGRPEVAFVGRSNVGKSSLMNRLLGRNKLARTSKSPGRTQAVNYFLVNGRFYFVDLPGYGFAKAPRAERRRWAELMQMYFEGSGPVRQLVQLVDGKVGATVLDEQAFEYFHHLDLEPMIVATKIDKVGRSRRARNLRAIRRRLDLPDSVAIAGCSAVSGEGVSQLWKGISVFLGHRPEKLQKVGMK